MSSRRRGRFTSSEPCVSAVDCSPGLHQGLRSRVSVGAHSWDQTFPLSGRLLGSLLLGAGSQTVRPIAPLNLSHPGDCDKREEVRSRALTDCEVLYLVMTIDSEAGKVFPSLARVEKFLTVTESFCATDAPPAQLW